MSDETGSTGGEAIAVIEAPADTGGDISLSQAAKALISGRERKPTAESADPATAENELSDEGNADPETDHGETEGTEAVDPPIGRPKSWSKDEDAEWQSLPRTMQQKIVARELERDTGTTRSQQEAANARKAAEAVQAQAEQKVQQYEAKLADQMQSLLDFNDQQFSNIKSQADVDFLANEALRLSQNGDPGLAGQYTAYLNAWQAHQQKMQGKRVELDQANQRKAQEKQTEARERKSRENTLLIEKAPEYADAAKLDTAQKSAAALFREKGFTSEQLANIVDENPILDDHRMQLIIDDASKYRELLKAKTAAVAKTVPPVQRPGPAAPRGNAQSERIQVLTRQLNETGDLRIAQQLRALQTQPRRAS